MSTRCVKLKKSSGNRVLTAGIFEFESSQADVVEGFVVEDHTFVGVLNELVDSEGCVVGLHHRVGDFRGRENREAQHHSVGEFFSYL